MAHSDKDLEQVHNEHEYLKTAWMRFMDEVINGTTLERHAPPALMSACMKIVEAQSGVEITGTEFNPMIGIPFQVLADYGATMYVFGQWCARDGLLAANMIPCGCDKIDDDELQRFISKS